MNKFRKNNGQNYSQNFMINHAINKSPLKRNNVNQNNHQYTLRSPIRSRTPIKNKIEINNNALFPTQMRYISNVSPIKERSQEPSYVLYQSNGQNIKYFKNNLQEPKYQTIKKDSKMEFSKKGDKNMQEENRLFGKIVDKLNSEKKNGLKSNDNSQKTSFFAQNSDRKSSKMDQLQIRTQTNYKNILNNNINNKTSEPKYSTNKKQQRSTKKRDNEYSEYEQNLSCLVYTIKNVQNYETQQLINQKQLKKQQEISKYIETKIVRRKSSKLLDDKQQKNLVIKDKDENQDRLLNMLLQKIENGCNNQLNFRNEDDEVKMSINLMKSLSMDPFI